jgi:DNA-binding protein H-NS
MEHSELASMPLEELWKLHEEISRILSARIIAEKQELESRLVQLTRGKVGRERPNDKLESASGDQRPKKRKYPKVNPKYQNPSAPSETWSGRGKQPRWLVSALNAGGHLEDFRISDLIPVSTHQHTR